MAAADPATDAYTSAAPPAVSPSPLVVGDSHCHSGRVFQCPYLAVVLRRRTLVRIAGVCGWPLEDPRTAVGGLRLSPPPLLFCLSTARSRFFKRTEFTADPHGQTIIVGAAEL